MKESVLNLRWEGWKGSKEGRGDFFTALSAQVYKRPGWYGFENIDEAAEALITHRERLAALLDRYEERGASFDAYITTSLRFIAKSRRRFERRRKERECACERAITFAWECKPEEEAWFGGAVTAAPGASAPADPDTSARPPSGETRRHRRARVSRLLFLFLKCAWDAGDRETHNMARWTGLSEDYLATTLAHARRFLEGERCRFERIVARRDRSWTALRILEARRAEELVPERRLELDVALLRSRREHEAALDELKRFRPLVPNSVVARILNVPKGSVDSGLHYLKREHPPSCRSEGEGARLSAWNYSSPPAMPINSSNSAPSFPAIASSGPPMSAIPALMSRRTARPSSKTPSKRRVPSST